ncbi:cytochrome P450 [Microdochium trichocladiopsis]|uniref:Cytochrome P450 n=1 Tax=Microdochium trichocladiopsis TaxID=1682393 RepID=A0A9P8YIR5_9PEZI|nr:cytochrome P450 [Microdochium trichocladiopsis]KAH7039774.1 cytochrome P450 [Microdochium trichocladiopsis]
MLVVATSRLCFLLAEGRRLPGTAGAYLVARCAYLIFFHPLAKLPGPKLYATTDLFYLYHLVGCTWPAKLKTLHDEYGPTIRFSPFDVSSIAPESWKTIYGHKSKPNKTFEKDRRVYNGPDQGIANIVIADNDAHRRMRRVLAHAFSEKALRGQETLIKSNVDLFISKVAALAEAKEPVNIMLWYNYITFDLIGDLAFGKPFGCLEQGGYHPWVKMVFESLAMSNFRQVLNRHPSSNLLSSWILPERMRRAFVEHAELSSKTAFERIERGNVGREDFMDHILRHNDEKGLSKLEIAVNSSTLITAGSETTATLLSGTTYMLLTNRDKYTKLVKDIRDRYASEAEITMSSVNELQYLLAVFNEGLRMYPPVPMGLPRFPPAGGETVDGYYIPEKSSIAVPHWAAYQCEQNWADPQRFVPERWLGTDPRYANDKRDVLQPFSTGPRNCIGKNLAYAEMRVILTRLLWRFDLELLPESKDWYNQRIFAFWKKGPLMVKVTPAQRS